MEGRFEEEEVTAVLDGVLSMNDSNHKGIRRQLLNHATNAKNGTAWFFELSIEHLRDIVPGFDAATSSQRRNLIIRLFNLAPCRTLRDFSNRTRSPWHFLSVLNLCLTVPASQLTERPPKSNTNLLSNICPS
jgi:hypothetical protein